MRLRPDLVRANREILRLEVSTSQFEDPGFADFMAQRGSHPRPEAPASIPAPPPPRLAPRSPCEAVSQPFPAHDLARAPVEPASRLGARTEELRFLHDVRGRMARDLAQRESDPESHADVHADQHVRHFRVNLKRLSEHIAKLEVADARARRGTSEPDGLAACE